jgi:hypothetical protein
MCRRTQKHQTRNHCQLKISTGREGKKRANGGGHTTHGQAAGYTVNTRAHITIQSLTWRIKQTNSKSQGRGGEKRANIRHKILNKKRVHADNTRTTHKQTAEHTCAYYTHAHTFAVVCSRSCSSKQTTPKKAEDKSTQTTMFTKRIAAKLPQLVNHQLSKRTNNHPPNQNQTTKQLAAKQSTYF